jgi:hypothetical protein
MRRQTNAATDDGPECPNCEGTCYAYLCYHAFPEIEVVCAGCHRLSFVKLPHGFKETPDVADLSDAHRNDPDHAHVLAWKHDHENEDHTESRTCPFCEAEGQINVASWR